MRYTGRAVEVREDLPGPSLLQYNEVQEILALDTGKIVPVEGENSSGESTYMHLHFACG